MGERGWGVPSGPDRLAAFAADRSLGRDSSLKWPLVRAARERKRWSTARLRHAWLSAMFFVPTVAIGSAVWSGEGGRPVI